MRLRASSPDCVLTAVVCALPLLVHGVLDVVPLYLVVHRLAPSYDGSSIFFPRNQRRAVAVDALDIMFCELPEVVCRWPSRYVSRRDSDASACDWGVVVLLDSTVEALSDRVHHDERTPLVVNTRLHALSADPLETKPKIMIMMVSEITLKGALARVATRPSLAVFFECASEFGCSVSDWIRKLNLTDRYDCVPTGMTAYAKRIVSSGA